MVDFPSDIVEMEAEDESINVLVFGESGAGKTPFAGSASNGLLIATEKGVISAQRRGSKMKVWKAPTWEKVLKAKEWLEEVYEEEGSIPFDWVSIDSGTMMQTLNLRGILRDEHAKAPSKRDLDIPQIQDHQKWQNEFKRTMQEFVDLPVNLCVTALPMSMESENSEGESEEWILPQFLGGKGAIAWSVVGMFGAGGRVELKTITDKETEKKKVVQRIHWTKNGNFWGRDRYDTLGRYTDNLTLDDLLAKVKSSNNSQQSSTTQTTTRRRRAASK